MIQIPTSPYVESRLLEKVLEYGALTTSYKLYWFKGIFNEILKGNSRITFKCIANHMIAEAWYPIVQYKLNFGHQDQLKELILYINTEFEPEINIERNKLVQLLERQSDEGINKRINNLFRYVPYRLIAPFYEQIIRGKADAQKNALIKEYSNKMKDAIYRIDDRAGMIIVNDQWYRYLYENQSIINGWFHSKLIYFLQKKNPNVPAIPFKTMPPYSRSLNHAYKLWTSVLTEESFPDIYTNKMFSDENKGKHGNLSIDHFIPWSFVLHDEIWNLIPTFKNINSSKSDNLPKWDKYFDAFSDAQYKLYRHVFLKQKSKKAKEDYLTVGCKLIPHEKSDGILLIPKNEFIDALESTMKPLEQIAYNQGFSVWEWGHGNGVRLE